MGYNFSAFPEAVSHRWPCRAQSQLFSQQGCVHDQEQDVDMNHQGVLAVKRANCTLGHIKHSITSLSRHVNVPLHHLECCVQVWTSCNALVHLVGLGEGFREALSCSP